MCFAIFIHVLQSNFDLHNSQQQLNQTLSGMYRCDQSASLIHEAFKLLLGGSQLSEDNFASRPPTCLLLDAELETEVRAIPCYNTEVKRTNGHGIAKWTCFSMWPMFLRIWSMFLLTWEICVKIQMQYIHEDLFMNLVKELLHEGRLIGIGLTVRLEAPRTKEWSLVEGTDSKNPSRIDKRERA